MKAKTQINRFFSEVKIDSIQPQGWIKTYLEKQRDGLTGHLNVAGFPFNTSSWSGHVDARSDNDVWWPYEQNGYWIDGMIRCGLLLEDKMLTAKAMEHINYNLENIATDGYIGPNCMRFSDDKTNLRWPHAVFFRAMMAYYSATSDARVPTALARHYLSNTSDHTMLRDVCNIEAMLWTYEKTGDKRLRDLAVDTYKGFNHRFPECANSHAAMSSDERAYEHGVTYNEEGKLGAILYMYTGNHDYLNASVNAYRKLDRDHMLIDGVVSSAEYLSGKDPLASHETCDIADYTWSVGYLLQATGEASYADKIERACFNAAPGAVSSDFKALQYFSAPNQVIADSFSNHNVYFRGHSWMSYRPCPNPVAECCPGQVNRIMPNFAARMWLRGEDGSLTAALYGPSRIETKVGEDQVIIEEKTSYPFSSRIVFNFITQRPVKFPFNFRIPGWCEKPSALFNGVPVTMELKTGTFATIEREFVSGDTIILDFPAELKLVRWPEGGIAIERGPLVFALGIKEKWNVIADEGRSNKDFPAWDLFAASTWNYTLDINEQTLSSIEIEERPFTGDPWSLANAPIVLKVPARRVLGWKTKTFKQVVCKTNNGSSRLKGNFVFTPPLPEPRSIAKRLGKRVETIELRPYGCTHLRITLFPSAEESSSRERN